MNKTTAYYDLHAEEYCQKTFHLNMTYPLQRFSFYLHAGDKVMDLGCGSGRDTLWLISHGFAVDAIDGSEKMAQLASVNTGINVKQMMFDQLDAEEEYDGIYACASLLHVPFAGLESILIKVFGALREKGIVYASFAYGDKEEIRNGRYYTDLNEERLLQIMKPHLNEWTVLELWHSHDALNRETVWFNMILRKIS